MVLNCLKVIYIIKMNPYNGELSMLKVTWDPINLNFHIASYATMGHIKRAPSID
jgi:hypothetical protein